MTAAQWTCLALAALAPLAFAQGTPPPALAPDAKPALDVATIKPSQPDETRLVYVEGTHLATRATTLVDLMTFAYSVHSMQIVGGPAWARSDRYDVLMQPDPDGRPSTAQMRSIMQGLLADRFQLQVHRASKGDGSVCHRAGQARTASDADDGCGSRGKHRDRRVCPGNDAGKECLCG